MNKIANKIQNEKTRKQNRKRKIYSAVRQKYWIWTILGENEKNENLVWMQYLVTSKLQSELWRTAL